jgi:subtilisin family serine protease
MNIKNLFITYIAFAVLGVSQLLAAPKIDPALREFARGASTEATATIIAVLETPKDGSAGTRPDRYDTSGVLKYLREQTKNAWTVIDKQLGDKKVNAKSVRIKRLHWINNSFVAEVTREGLKALATADGIKKIYANHRITFEEPFSRGRIFDDPELFDNKMPYDFVDSKLTDLIKEHPELTGKDILIGSVDTGVDAKHAALSGKIAAFYDGDQKKLTEPKDSDSHGTHTIGTMVGGSRENLNIGMAPDARVFSAGPLNGYAGMLDEMEAMLKPATEDPNALPRAVNNSWHAGGAPDIELFYRAISAWEASGILPVFSAGNAGPSPGSLTRPKEHPGVVAVAATGKDGKVTDFSSRGPGTYKGEKTMKPDLSAPGEDILSTVPGGGFQEMSGTSMAAPHVTGTVALLLQVDSKFTPSQLKMLLMGTATPTKSDGMVGEYGDWNPVYGYGKLNVYKAAKLAMEAHAAREDLAIGTPDLLRRLFSSPLKLTADTFFASPGKFSIKDFDLPQEAEGLGWLTAADLEN